MTLVCVLLGNTTQFRLKCEDFVGVGDVRGKTTLVRFLSKYKFFYFLQRITRTTAVAIHTMYVYMLLPFCAFACYLYIKQKAMALSQI